MVAVRRVALTLEHQIDQRKWQFFDKSLEVKSELPRQCTGYGRLVLVPGQEEFILVRCSQARLWL